MEKNQTPTLIIGLGGIGGTIATSVYDQLSDEDKMHIGFILIDSDPVSLFEKNAKYPDIQTICINDGRTVNDYLTQYPEVMKWFPYDSSLADVNTAITRSITRLMAFAAEREGHFRSIDLEAQRLRMTSDNNHDVLSVMVVGTSQGNTSSGLFPLIPSYLRKLCDRSSISRGIALRGMLVDVTDYFSHLAEQIKESLLVNTYALMKELNASYALSVNPSRHDFTETELYETQDISEHSEPENNKAETVSSTDTAKATHNTDLFPYDFLYLVEPQADRNGNDFSEILDLLSSALLSLIFTEGLEYHINYLRDTRLIMHELADNDPLNRRWRERYAGVGVSRLAFPLQKVQDYLTMYLVNASVKDYWSAPDRAAISRLRNAKDCHTSFGFKELSREKVWCESFIHEIISGSLGFLHDEVFSEEEISNHYRCDNFMTQIHDDVHITFDSAFTEADIIRSSVDRTELLPIDSMYDEAREIYTNLVSLRTAAEEAVQGYAEKIADSLFPLSLNDTEKNNKGYGIYSSMFNVHPMTARFFCYRLLELLGDNIGKLESLKSSTSTELDIMSAEFQSRFVYTSFPDSIKRSVFLDKLGMLSHNTKRRKYYKPLKTQVDYYIELIKAFFEINLELKVCRTLIDRMYILRNVYESFFSNMSDIVANNDKQMYIFREENEVSFFKKHFFSQRSALDWLTVDAHQYLAKHEQFGLISHDSDYSFFDRLYAIAVSEIREHDDLRGEISFKNKWDTALRDVFMEEIHENVRKDVRSYLSQINIMDAMRNQMKIEKQIIRYDSDFDLNPVEYDDLYREYVKSQIEKAIIMAEPMINAAEHHHEDLLESIYIAVNPEILGAYENGDSSEWEHKYLSDVSINSLDVHPKLLVNDAFSSNEILCIRTRHSFMFEDLLSYRQGSEYEQAYRRHISEIGNTSDVIRTVTPHLDKHWHENLPAIGPEKPLVEE